MDEKAFRQELERDGFANIREVAWDPNSVNSNHVHDFTARGLVLSGSFTLSSGSTEKTCNAGDIFELAAGTPHEETIGSSGARVLVGRK